MDETPVTDSTPAVANPTTSPDAFFADRAKFWAGFTGFGTIAVIVIITIVAMLGIFLV